MATSDNANTEEFILESQLTQLGQQLAHTYMYIEPTATKRQIMATTSPTDAIHKATLITTALLPVYNHVLMVLPVEPHHTTQRFNGSFGRSKWIDKQSKKTGSKETADSRGGNERELCIPCPDQTIKSFQQNLL
jgi:hypothetical protein